MKRVFLSAFLGISLSVFAQAPSGYYNSAEGKKTEALKTALYLIIDNHTSLSYKALWTAFKYTDKRADGKVWDIYSSTTNYTFGSNQCGLYTHEGSCYNREHSFPKSWFSKAAPMNSDLFHLYPSDGYVNNKRGNLPFGEVRSVTYSSNGGFCKVGSCSFPGYSGTVFEPNDEYKGDLARTYFYMVTRYENRVGSWDSPQLAGNSYPALNSWSVKMLLKWHRNDPVSQKEIDRNNTIYSKYQHNRNPFIDHPELAEYIWGTKKGQQWSKGTSVGATIISPENNSVLDFGSTVANQQIVKTITIKGQGLESNINLEVTGKNASDFTLSQSVLSKTNVLSGADVTVTFVASSLGDKTAQLLITGGGTTGTTVSLSATVVDGFAALNATEIKEDGFVANWTQSTGATNYKLDVYTKEGSSTQSKVLVEEDFNSSDNSWKKEGYTSFKDEDGAIRLASGKNNGAVTTPTLDLLQPATVTVKAKQYNNDKEAPLFIDVDGNQLTQVVTNQDYKEFTVELDAYTATSKITFRAGKGKRVFIDHIKVETKQATTSNTSIQDFPKNVGNVTKYAVSGLEKDKKYYYTVIPQGNGADKSNEIMVYTSTEVPVVNPESIFSNLKVYTIDGMLFVEKIPANSIVELFDVYGRKFFTKSNSKQVGVNLMKGKGIYLLKITTDLEEQPYILKILN